jgi:nucleoside-diphosphate-sugar epimerase
MNSVLQSFAEECCVSIACGRPFYIYGPNEHVERLVPYVITNLLNNEAVMCRNGSLIRDYLYVEDVADAFVSLLISDIEGVVNIASGQPITIRDLVNYIAEKINKKSLVQINNNSTDKNQAKSVLASTKRLNYEVQWLPIYSLDAALDKTLLWWGNKV